MRGPGSRLPPPIGHKLRAGRKDNLHKNSTKGIALYRIRESGMQCFSIAQVWNHRSKGRLSINVFLWNAGIRALVYHFDGIAKTSVCLLTYRVAEIWLSGTWNFGSCTPISKSIFSSSHLDYQLSSLPCNSWMTCRFRCLDQMVNCRVLHISFNICILWCSSAKLPTCG